MDADLHDLTAAYALDALDADEADAYEARLRACADLPSVDVLIATVDEPLAVVERTMRAALGLDSLQLLGCHLATVCVFEMKTPSRRAATQDAVKM